MSGESDIPFVEETGHEEPDETSGFREQPDFERLEASPTVDELFAPASDEPPFSRCVLTTSLHLSVAAESRTNRWTDWNGYTTPEILTTIDDEYRALRQAAALSDISPMVKYRISGRDAASYLDRLVADNVMRLSVDEVMPVVFCEDRGFVVGDGHLFRLGESEYRLVTEETHLAWLLDSALGFQVHVEDVGAALAALSLQGPHAAAVLNAAGFYDIETIRPYAARWFDLGGIPVYASRTGATGELGYELWVDPEDAPMLWARLFDKGAEFGLAATGYAVRELARIEAGIPRVGCDYLGAFAAVDLADASTPFELGLASLVDLESGHFTGRDALRRLKQREPRHLVVSMALDFPEPVQFCAVEREGAIDGTATSIGFSPALGLNLALARLRYRTGPVALSVEVDFREGLSVRRLKIPARLLTEAVIGSPMRHAVPAPLLAEF